MERDFIKSEYHWQQAAMLGNGSGRHNLCWYEYEGKEKGNANRAIKHWIIAAGTGFKDSLDYVRQSFFAGMGD